MRLRPAIALLLVGVLIGLILGYTLSEHVRFANPAAPTPSPTGTRLAPAPSTTPATASPTIVVSPAADSGLVAARGTTYYVSDTGSDANPCTRARPCASASRAGSLAHPGDTIGVITGTYVITAGTPPQTSVLSVYDVVGRPTAPITLAALGPVTMTRAVDASGVVPDSEQNNPLMRFANDAYVTVRGFTLIGSIGQPGYNPNDEPYGGEMLFQNAAGASNGYLTVQGNTVEHAVNTCIKFQDGQPYETIVGNVLIDCGAGPNGYLNHPIYFTGPHSVVASNVISGTSGFGIQGRGDDGWSLITDNVVEGVRGGAGITVDAHPMTITDNIIVSPRNGCVQLNDGVGQTFTGNQCIDADLGGDEGGQTPVMLSGIYSQPISGTIIAHNTFYNARTVYGEIRANASLGNGPVQTGPLTIADNLFIRDRSLGFGPNLSLYYGAPSPISTTLASNAYVGLHPIEGCTSGPYFCHNVPVAGHPTVNNEPNPAIPYDTDPQLTLTPIIPTRPGLPATVGVLAPIPDLHPKPSSPLYGKGVGAY